MILELNDFISRFDKVAAIIREEKDNLEELSDTFFTAQDVLENLDDTKTSLKYFLSQLEKRN
jgi:hypothetical protein